MGLINQDIKNLVSGISQQPPLLRYPEQLEEQINGFSSEASGLQKRPPTLHIAKLNSALNANSKPKVHFINRDDVEKYTVIFTGSGIEVFDMAGNKKTVTIQEDGSYLAVSNPRKELKVCTIADYTFITNTTKKVEMRPDLNNTKWTNQGALINIKSGQYGRTYKIIVDDVEVASFTTPDGSNQAHSVQIATDNIVTQLKIQATAKGFTVQSGSSWLYLYKAGMNKVQVLDGYNNQAAFGIMRTVQKFSYLPVSAPDGFTVKVAGEDGSSTDDYYVSYSAADEVWKECARPGITYRFNEYTMPHVLVRQADGTFIFKRGEWSYRETGDEDSNPLPSFIDFTINDIFYHRNRLGFLSGENVILSNSGDFFNFWMASAVSVQDTDPIDLAVSDSTISTLYHAVSFDAELLLFAEDAQFALQTSNVLTPKDAYITSALTHFGCSSKAKPVNAGRNVYFTAERNRYTTVREYFTAADNTESKDAQDITSHVPSFIPNTVYEIIPSNVENLLLFLSDGDTDSIYIYKYLFIDSQRQQAAWSKWNFGGHILGATFMDGFLFILINRSDSIQLEKMSFTYNNIDIDKEPFRVLLDRKVKVVPQGTMYDAWEGITTLNIHNIYGQIIPNPTNYYAVTDQGRIYVANEQGEIHLPGNYTTLPVFVGEQYLFRITMSPIMVKLEGDGAKALIEGRLQLRQVWFNYAESGYFKVLVTVGTRQPYVYENTQRALGTLTNQLDILPIRTGTFKVPVQSLNTNCTITLESDQPIPLSLIGAGWIGNYVRKTRNM